jgi:hypothetical protein
MRAHRQKKNREIRSSSLAARASLGLTLILAPGAFAVEPPTPGNIARMPLYWKWDLARDWAVDVRRARATMRTFADREANIPFDVDVLRFSLEIDCPATGKPERVASEGKMVSQLEVEVACPSAATDNFEVRWAFEANDPRTGPVQDRGVWK